MYWYDENGSSQNWGTSPTKNGSTTVSSSTNNATNCGTFSYTYTNTWGVKRMGKVTNASSTTSGYVVVGAGTTVSFTNTSYQYSTNQTFTRWHYSTSWISSQPSSSSVTASTSDTMLCVYVRKLYSVAFMYKSGSGGAYTYSVGAGLSTTAPTASAPTGYTFAGWSSSWDNGGSINSEYYNGDSVSVEGGKTITVDSDLTYYAVYTPNTYTISLDSAYYSSSSATSGTAATSKGTTNIYVLYQVYYYKDSNCSTTWSPSYFTAPTYTGYTFGGYYTGKAGTGTQILTAAGACTAAAWTDAYFLTNPTLYAKWTINTYTLTVRYYRQFVSAEVSRTQIKVTQSSCTVTDNYGTTTDGILSCDLAVIGFSDSVSTTYYASVSHTYTTSSYTVTIARQNTIYDYYMNATTSSSTVPTMSSSMNSVTYSWKPTSNATIYVNLFQRIECELKVEYNVTNTTGIAVTTSIGYLSGDSLSETSTIYLYYIPSTESATINLSRQNASYNYNIVCRGTTKINSNSFALSLKIVYSAVNCAVYQRYTITYNGNGYTSGTVPSTQYKIHGTSLTLESNSLTKTNYSANGWNTGSAYKATSDYTSSSTYSTNANLTLYANFVPNTCSVTIKLMMVTKTGTASNSTTGGTISLKSTVYDTSSSTLVTTQTVSITSASATQTVQKNKTMTFTPTTTSGYVFCGVSSSTSVPTKNTITSSVTPTSATTYYAYFRELSTNQLKYDSTNKYYYFEDGYMPQTYAEMISSGLNANITSNGTLLGNFSLENGTSYKLASYSGYYYLGFVAPKAMTLDLVSYTTSGTYSFTKGTTYWFRFEPIRWRVSTEDWYNNGYIGMYDTNYTVVSDLVLWYDCMDTNENHKEGDKAYDMSFTSSLRTGGKFETMLSTFASAYTSGKLQYSGSNSVEWQKFGEANQQNPVLVDSTNTSSSYSLTNTNKYTSGSTSSLRVASIDEISNTVGNNKAYASCLVAFLMGSSNDQYSKYWTRDLGNTLNAGTVVAKNGLTRSEWLSNSNGIRFAYTMSEGSRGNL